MAFTITDEMAREIKEYCAYQEFDKEKGDYRTDCKYCVFNNPKKCLLHNETMGFPSDWNV